MFDFFPTTEDPSEGLYLFASYTQIYTHLILNFNSRKFV